MVTHLLIMNIIQQLKHPYLIKMIIHIPVSDLDPNVRKLYLENRIKHLGIDYAPNSIMGWCEEEEIEVFNFDRVCKLDNRWTGYEIYKNRTEIIIEITNL